MLKIRRPLGRLIFNMGIAIPGKTVFLIETAPWFPCHQRQWHWLWILWGIISTGYVISVLWNNRKCKYFMFAFLKRNSVRRVKLFIIYLLGARSTFSDLLVCPWGSRKNSCRGIRLWSRFHRLRDMLMRSSSVTVGHREVGISSSFMTWMMPVLSVVLWGSRAMVVSER